MTHITQENPYGILKVLKATQGPDSMAHCTSSIHPSINRSIHQSRLAVILPLDS